MTRKNGFIRTNMRREKMLGIVFIFLFLIVLSSISVSALFGGVEEIGKGEKLQPIIIGDKEIPYNDLWEKYPAIEITDWFGLVTKAEGVITEHTESCSIDCKSKFVINLKEDGILVEDIRFDKLVGKDWIEIVKDYELLVDDKIYELGTKVPSGTYTITIKGTKKPSTIIDWKIKTQGEWINDWAVWGSSAGLVTDTISRLYDTTFAPTTKGGQIIKANTNTYIINVSKFTVVTATKCYVYNYLNLTTLGTLLGNSTFSGNECLFPDGIAITQGSEYVVVVDNAGSSYTDAYYNGATSYPKAGTNINWTGVWFQGAGSTTTYTENIANITTGVTGAITLNSPANATYTTSNPVTFNCSATVIGTTLKNVSLIFNGVLNETKTITGTTNTTTFDKNISSDKTWSCKFCDNEDDCGTSTRELYYGINFGICDGTRTIPYLNFTFKNETTLKEIVSATMSVSLNYSTYNITGSKVYTFVNTTENPSYSFCSDINTNIIGTPTLTYGNSYSYSRNFYEVLNLTNSLTTRTLYLLPSSLGQYVVFTVTDSLGQNIPQALINVYLTSGELVEGKLTDDLGAATLFLNPLTNYQFVVTKTGLTTYSQIFAPTLTSYILTMGGISNSTNSTIQDNINSVSKGITIVIKPTSSTLVNNTIYNFNMTITAASSNLDSYGIIVGNTTKTFASSSGTTAAGGIVSVSLNTVKNTTFVANYWYNIDGTYGNYTKIYYIYDSSGGEFGLTRIGTDFGNLVGIFGLTQFGLSIIIFLIIFVITGIMAYKFGLSSPAMISLIVFFLVMLFDVGLGLISNPINAVSHFPTIFIGLIMLGLFVRELANG